MAKQQGQDQAAHGLNVGSVVDGRYKIVRFIGQGGNGLVYEVEHARTGRRLALKSLVDESGRGRLEQEARATCLMRNNHAVRITDMGTAVSGHYLVMELLEGQSLRALLEEAGQIPLELTVNIALQVCECLTEAHGLGIIHRDLKPENIYLSPSSWQGQYDVRVLDFGVVKITSDGPIPNSSLTRTGSTVGTPYYMSLEQLRNPSAVDARADIYALGVVLYESLSGRKPFEAETIGDLVYALCSGPPTHLNRLRPDLPAEICDAVMRALSMKREDRQATMVEFASVLLPHGNQAFGLWIRAPGKTRPGSALTGASPAAPRPLRGTVPLPPASVTPSGLKPAPQPPVAALPIAAPPIAAPPQPPVAAPPVAAPAAAEPAPPEPAAAPQPQHQMLPDAEQPTRVRAERPTLDLSGNRDTPTEMFVKGRHDNDAPSGNRNTPTQGLPIPPGFEHDPGEEEGSMTARYEPQSSSAPIAQHWNSPVPAAGGAPPDMSKSSEMLGTMRLPTEGLDSPVAEVRAALGGGMQMAPPSNPGMMGPPPGMQATMPFGQSHLDAQNQARSAMMGGAPMGPPNGQANPFGGPLGMTRPPGDSVPRPGWQQSLDNALIGSGRLFERVIGPLVQRIRGASPKMQLVLAAVVASTFAAILVILIYVLLG